MRQIVLDTETTGLEVSQGHRIIEIGAVELLDRKLTGNHFHRYVNPRRRVDDGAFEVHGISDEFLADQPDFRDIADEFIEFVRGAELIIHNAPFDVAFLDNELMLERPGLSIGALCPVTDSLALARRKHPGQKNSLDALCRRYLVDNSARQLHGALLDAEILADVYLALTGGQTLLFGTGHRTEEAPETRGPDAASLQVLRERPALSVLMASDAEIARHQALLDLVEAKSGRPSLWRHLEDASGSADCAIVPAP